MNHIAKHVLHKSISPIQRGFVPGRQLTSNVLDLDAYAHIHALSSDSNKLPLLVFFDFAAAFPSISHTWLFLILRALNFPIGFIN